MSFPRMFCAVLAALLVIVNTSCMKDVDFDQAGDITLQPEIQADLLIFEIESKDFIDPQTNEFQKIIIDTVRLEFLDDDYIQNDLDRVEFRFRFRNTFTQSFLNKIYFLSENNNLQHYVEFYTAAGSAQNPAVSEKIDYVGPENIHVIKRSIKMVMEIEVLPNDQPFVGKLNFESKGLFSFQF